MARRISSPVFDMNRTGEHIKKIRQEQNLSTIDVQNFLGFSNPLAIYQCQKGISLPSVDHLCALSHLFDVPRNDIIVLANTPEAPPSARRIPFVTQTMFLLVA